MNEVRDLISRLVAAGLDPIEAAEIITRAAIAGSREATRSSAAIRQERYRRNKASQSVTRDAPVTGAPSPKESPQTPKETPPSTPKETPLRGSKKGSRLPADFAPDFDFALRQGLTRSQAEAEAAKFRDYWLAKSGQGATKQDWQATWRNWVRTAAERIGPRQRAGPTSSQQPSPMDHFRNFANELNHERDREGRGDSRDWDDAPGVPVRTIEHHG